MASPSGLSLHQQYGLALSSQLEVERARETSLHGAPKDLRTGRGGERESVLVRTAARGPQERLDRGDEVSSLKRLLEERLRTYLLHLPAVLRATQNSTHGNHGKLPGLIPLPELDQNCAAVLAGKKEIQQHKARLGPLDGIEGGIPVVGEPHAIPDRLEGASEQIRQRTVVFDDQNFLWHAWSPVGSPGADHNGSLLRSCIGETGGTV